MFPTIGENLDRFSFGIITNTDVLNIYVHVFWSTQIHISIDYIPKSRFLAYRVYIFSFLILSTKEFSKVVIPVYTPYRGELIKLPYFFLLVIGVSEENFKSNTFN